MWYPGRRSIFVDTGAWFAVQADDDAHHQVATDTWRALLVAGHGLHTSNTVVGETYTLLRDKLGYAAAWRFVEWIDGAHRLTRHHITSELEQQAYGILRQYRDQAFSFVDATSFACMRSTGITEAFAFDVHYATAGFMRIPVDRPVG